MPKGIYQRTEETKRKMSLSKKGKISGMKGKKMPEEAKKKISEWHKGKHHSPITEFKKGIIPKTCFKKGHKNSEETRRKISERMKGKKLSIEHILKLSGKNCHFWLSGVSFEPYSVNWTETLKRSIRERDHYVCRICLKNGWIIHHIDYDKKNCDPKNLINLCKICHAKTNFNRDYWIKFFNDKNNS